MTCGDSADALGLVKPVVLGSSFGGFVTLTYAGMFPGHPGGVILTNTSGGRIDHPASVEIFTGSAVTKQPQWLPVTSPN